MNKKQVNFQEDVDFNYGEVYQNKYKLNDRTILRFFAAPAKFMRSDQFDKRGMPQYFVATSNIVSATVPNEERGQPSNNPPLPADQMDYDPIDFEPIDEPWNRYELVDGTIIRLRVTASQILKSTKRRNAFGEYIYTVDHNLSIDVRAPKHMRRRG